ncbi:universal stress protein [Planobispora siamensis]|uniref:Universal stress protein n=1 Tax=Planobispora siamensis TaxID=936338 RepID=A0A8J3SJD1_9ACTN|nr:universal stress protein [Planobispora siamensis]GIH93475.1 universal stress protein [Planobispora siamensis]
MGKAPDYRTIVVGTDGSPLAAPTVTRAAWLAARADADLVIVCAYAELSRRQEARNVATLGDSRVGRVPGRDTASAAVASAVALAREQGATIAAALMADGDPASTLLSTVRDRAADLLVVGALRDPGIADRLLGTVAAEVVRRADCEVLIVRLPHGAPGHHAPRETPPA